MPLLMFLYAEKKERMGLFIFQTISSILWNFLLIQKDIIKFVDRSLACVGTQVKMDLFYAC